MDAGAANALIDRAIERHGGEQWARLSSLTLAPFTLTGMLPWMKGHGRTFRLPREVRVVPSAAQAVFVDYPLPREGRTVRGVFDAGCVALEGEPLRAHRSTFRGFAKWRRWAPVDALYFFGYALTHYHALPWSLRDAELLSLHATRRSGAAHALTVRFPASGHTHSPLQTIYFDSEGLIVRHDYVADIVGPWARGAHLWRDYVTVEGIPIATHRKVFARVGALLMPLVALDARFGPPRVVLKAGSGSQVVEQLIARP